MRAPPESFRPMIGAPFFIARSMIFTIFAACVSVSEPPLPWAVAGDDAVARYAVLLHPEVGGAMDDELVELLERAGIEEERDTLPRRQFPFVVLTLDPLLTTTELT